VLPIVFLCAVCGAADPTLPVAGAEASFKNRVRVTTDARAASFRSIQDSTRVDEARVELWPSWSPVSDFTLSAGIPIVWRSIGPSPETVMGDVELRATMMLWQAKPSATRSRLSAFAGFKLPSAPIQKDATGKPLPTDLQPGCGSIVTLVGGYYTVGRGMWTMIASAQILLPTPVRDGPHPGTSFRTGLVGQFQPWKSFGMRLGAQGRYDTSGAIGGTSDPYSGGAALFVVPELVISPAKDLVFTAGASFPAAQDLKGYRVLGPVALVSASYDF
jgi:hypothetical protein